MRKENTDFVSFETWGVILARLDAIYGAFQHSLAYKDVMQ
jgi:hypothetical protein